MKTTLNLFIVPNPAYCYDGCSGNGPAGGPTPTSFIELGYMLGSITHWFGFDAVEGIDLSTQWVQVWIHDEKNDNLTDHGIPEDHVLAKVATRAIGALPETIARKIAKGGFTSVIRYDKDGHRLAEPIEVEWVPTQETTRYARFGSFAEVLDKVIADSKHFEKPEAKKAFEEYKRLLKEANA